MRQVAFMKYKIDIWFYCYSLFYDFYLSEIHFLDALRKFPYVRDVIVINNTMF